MRLKYRPFRPSYPLCRPTAFSSFLSALPAVFRYLDIMSWNEPYYRQYEQRPEEVPLSPVSKQSYPTVTPVEQHWVPQNQIRYTCRSRSFLPLLWEWKWEFATWLLGSCALGGIVALLVHYQGRPLQEWTIDIRLATVVAALSQVAQSALLVSVSSCIGQLKWDWFRKERSASDLDKFEEASRGPQGSLFLLPRTGL